MKLSDRLLEELNKQIMYEFFSAQYYLAMAGYCADQNLAGFENFFIAHDHEERSHAMRIYHFINEMGHRVDIQGFEDPDNDFDSVEGVFKAALEHEEFVTDRIKKLMDIAVEEKNYAAISFLQWFIDEQVEEEELFSGILEDIRRVGSTGTGLLLLDRELAKREIGE